MSKKCTHCGSYNTEAKVSGKIGYNVVQAVRIATAGGAAIVGGFLGPSTAHAAGHSVMNNTKDWGEDINKHHCCNCGKDFK